MPKMNGGEVIAEYLVKQKVPYIFGICGHGNVGILDALYHLKDKISLISPRHEQCAGHMADAYSRVTGKTGVVLVTSGPGATNTVTPIATAYMDSIPMVILSGQVASHLIGEDAFQETDMVGISRPIVKHSFQVRHASEIPAVKQKVCTKNSAWFHSGNIFRFQAYSAGFYQVYKMMSCSVVFPVVQANKNH